MLIDLSDVFTSEGKERRESLSFAPESFLYMGNRYKIHDKSPAHMVFSNIGKGKAMIKGGMELVMDIPCDRCLKIVEVPFDIRFEQEVFAPDLAGEIGDGDRQWFMQGSVFDAEAFLDNEILINMPVKVLCRPDCKGICKKCGHDLNEGECGCDMFVPDPRMAAIKDIFYADKEV